MSTREFQTDIRLRRKFVPLLTQQYRLRHLVCICARNLQITPSDNCGVYFTLHDKPDAKAFYTSELVFNTADPCWAKFNQISRFEAIKKPAPCVVIKIWAQHSDEEEPVCVTEWAVYFSGLCFIGEHVPKEGEMFTPNSILFNLLEGYFGDHNCLKGYKPYKNVSYIVTHPQSLRSSYSAQALIRLKTTERAIQQTECTATQLREKIATQLQAAMEGRKARARLTEVRLRVASLRTALWCQVHALQELETRSQALDKELEQQQQHLLLQNQLTEAEMEQLNSLQTSFYEAREAYVRLNMTLGQRQRELITQLASIYTIEETPDKKGHQILKIHLPQSEEFPAHADPKLGIALGYVCHLLLMLSFFLNHPLRYPITLLGSKSTIHDYISPDISDRNRELPLFLKGKERVHFEYGVFLLNKNIALLRHFCGLSTPDLRYTLYNLQSLINLKFNLNLSTNQLMGNSTTVPATQYARSEPQNTFLNQGALLGSRSGQHSSVPNLAAAEPPAPLSHDPHWSSTHSLDVLVLNGDSSTALNGDSSMALLPPSDS